MRKGYFRSLIFFPFVRTFVTRFGKNGQWSPGGAQKNRSNQFSRSGFLKAMRHLVVEMGDARHAWGGD